MEVLYKYTGAGFVVGLPSRDILADETEFHADCEANSKTTLPCYVKVEAARAATSKKVTREAAAEEAVTTA